MKFFGCACPSSCPSVALSGDGRRTQRHPRRVGCSGHRPAGRCEPSTSAGERFATTPPRPAPEGTSIKLVSERSSLPASSIYWHFKDKDELIAAVIDASFTDWVDSLTTVPDLPVDADPEQLFVQGMRDAGEQLAKFPDFLRLGLMLILEQRPEEPAARQRFRQARVETIERVDQLYQAFFTGLTPEQTARLATFTLAGSDGLFVAANEGTIDLADEFELLAHAVLGAARGLGWSSGQGAFPARASRETSFATRHRE